MMVRVTIIAPAGSNADDFPASLEIIEDGVQSGETAQAIPNTDWFSLRRSVLSS